MKIIEGSDRDLFVNHSLMKQKLRHKMEKVSVFKSQVWFLYYNCRQLIYTLTVFKYIYIFNIKFKYLNMIFKIMSEISSKPLKLFFICFIVFCSLTYIVEAFIICHFTTVEL